MHKELNPELFGERKNSKGTGAESAHTGGLHGGSLSSSASGVHGMSSSLSHPGDRHGQEASFLNTDRQIFELKTQNHQLQDQINKLTAGMNEFIKNANQKFERTGSAISRLETSHNGLAQETGQKFVHIGQKMTERKALDAKIQEMVDRHNNIVKSFEVRMNHLQKLLADKDAQMLMTQATLNETRMELARLKRM